MTNRPEEVTSYISSTQDGNCSVVVTYDSLLAFTTRNELPHVSLLTPNQFPLSTHLDSQAIAKCGFITLNLIRSSLNDIAAGDQISEEIESVAASLHASKTRNFSFDPDAAGKQRLAGFIGGSDIPTYRYVVTSAQVPPGAMREVEEKLRHFY
jgi:hypothetical protein